MLADNKQERTSLLPWDREGWLDNLELLLRLRPDPWLTITGSGRGIVVAYQDADDYTFSVYGKRSLKDTLADADKAAAELIEEITRKGEERR